MKYQRHIDMLQYIINKGNVSIEELLSHFNVSKATLNRDINELVKSGNVSKVHGGVVSTVNSGEFEQVIEDKERLNISFKTKIAGTEEFPWWSAEESSTGMPMICTEVCQIS